MAFTIFLKGRFVFIIYTELGHEIIYGVILINLLVVIRPGEIFEDMNMQGRCLSGTGPGGGALGA